MAHDSDVITPRAPSSVVVNLMIRRVENPEVPQWLETQLALLCGTQGGALVVCIGWGTPGKFFLIGSGTLETASHTVGVCRQSL